MIPTAEEIVPQTRPLLLVVRAALRYGIQRAGDFFDEEAQEPDPWLAAHLVRWHAKRYLNGAGHNVHDLDEDYGTEDVSNSGLRGSYKNFGFIVRKQDGGLLPAPISDTQRTWHSHNQSCFEFIHLDGPTIHLAILWDADSKYRELTSLELALPKANGEAYWYESILNLTEVGATHHDSEDALHGDLPIELNDEQQHGGADGESQG